MRFTQADYIAACGRMTKTKQPTLAPFASSKSEAALHQEIMDECRRRGWLFFHGAMCERTHRTEGEPDFIILRDCGPMRTNYAPRTLLIECKSAKGKQSPSQLAVAAHAAKLGHTVYVVRSMEEFLEIVK